MNIEQFSPVALVVGVTEVIKRTGKVPHEFLPLVNLVLGVFFVFIMQSFLFSGSVLIQGIVTGLVAGGLYDTVKGTYSMVKK